DAILARISPSWSAIALPDERVGLNLRLRALLLRADGPAIDRPSLPQARNPWLRQRGPVNREEGGIGEPDSSPAAEGGEAVPNDQSAANLGQIGLEQARQPRVEAHYAEGAAVALE